MTDVRRCDICAIKGAKRFQLLYKPPQKRGVPGTTKGSGSILLCERCWKKVTEGHRYKRFPGYCRDGAHKMEGENLTFHKDGHRVCRACRHIAQVKYNAKKRAERAARGLKGRAFTPEQRLRHSRTMKAWAERRTGAAA